MNDILEYNSALGGEAKFRHLYLCATKECNLRCRHCYLGAGPGMAMENELSPEEMIRFIEDLRKKEDLRDVALSGGEPLVKKDIEKVIEYVLNHGLRLNVETNGTLIREPIASLLSRYERASVGISIDGIGETHNVQRGNPHAFETTLKGLKTLQHYGASFGISTYVTPENIHEMDEIAKISVEHGANIYRVLGQTVPTGRSKGAKTCIELVQKTIDKFWEIKLKYEDRIKVITDLPIALMPKEHIDDIEEYAFCEWWSLIGVTPVGDVSLCTALSLHPENIAGNIRKNSLEELKNAELFRILDRKNQFNLKGICGNCQAERICRGYCRSMSYSEYKDLLSPYTMCQTFYEEGKFPDYAMIDPHKDSSYPSNH